MSASVSVSSSPSPITCPSASLGISSSFDAYVKVSAHNKRLDCLTFSTTKIFGSFAQCPSTSRTGDPGHILDGTFWFTNLFSLATLLNRVSTTFILLLLFSPGEVRAGLVPNVDVNHHVGEAALVLILIILVVSSVSTGTTMSR
jgi:hypothetical protein